METTIIIIYAEKMAKNNNFELYIIDGRYEMIEILRFLQFYDNN